MLFDEIAQYFFGGIGRTIEISCRLKSPFFFADQPVPNEPGHQPLENRSHCSRYLKGRYIKRNGWSYSHFRQAARQLRRRQIIRGMKGQLQPGVAANATIRSTTPVPSFN